MNKNNIDYTLYLCTDQDFMSTDTVEECVELAIKGGCTVVQIREKNCSSLEFYYTAINVKKITDKYKIPLIINDRADIAAAINADGVHVGQSDLPVDAVRKIIGNDKIIGVSASTVDEAVKAAADGADYLGVGAMFPTGTKTNAHPVTVETLKLIRNTVNIPIVVIGGINKERAGTFKDTGINGFAVVSAVAAQKDITAAAQDLVKTFNEIK